MASIRRLVAAAALAAVGPLACAKTEKSNNPLSPDIAGPIPWVEIEAPTLMEPGRDWRIKTNEQPIQLLIENADTNGPRPLVYRFQIATDAGFRTIVFAREGVPQGNGGQTGRTALRLPDRLQDGRTYYWRAQAYDGANSGPFTAGINFQIQFPPRVFDPVPVDPVNGETVSGNRPHLRVRNATKQGPVLPVNYMFQVSPNPSFTAIVAQGAMPEGASETVYLPSAPLQWGTTYYWRVAAGDGVVGSSWAFASFRTPNPGSGAWSRTRAGSSARRAMLGLGDRHRHVPPFAVRTNCFTVGGSDAASRDRAGSQSRHVNAALRPAHEDHRQQLRRVLVRHHLLARRPALGRADCGA